MPVFCAASSGDAVMLRPPRHVGVDACRCQLARKVRHHLADGDSRSCRRSSRSLGDRQCGRLERAQRLVESHFICQTPRRSQRREEPSTSRAVERRKLSSAYDMAQGLDALGRLDQDDPDIVDHREQHLPQPFGLGGASAASTVASLWITAHPGNAFDQHRHPGPNCRSARQRCVGDPAAGRAATRPPPTRDRG